MGDIDSVKFLKRWNLKVENENKANEILNTIARRLTMNIIKNIIHVKEAMHGKTDNKISMKDVKESADLMKRLRFYSQLQFNMKGGSRTVLPPSYFNADAPEPMYNPEYADNLTRYTQVESGSIVRPEFASSQFKGDGIIDFPGPDGMQSGGGLLEQIKRVFKSRPSVKLVDKQGIEGILAEMNKKYKKNPISLESDAVAKAIKDSVNQNLNILVSFYTGRVSKTTFSADKLKKLVDEEPMLRHMSKVPTNS